MNISHVFTYVNSRPTIFQAALWLTLNLAASSTALDLNLRPQGHSAWNPRRDLQEEMATWTSDTVAEWTDNAGQRMRADLAAGTVGPANRDSAAPNAPNLVLKSDSPSAVWNGVYYVYEFYVEDSSSGQTYPVAPEGMNNALLALAFWLPHPTENRLAFVYENNIYVKYDPLGQETYQ